MTDGWSARGWLSTSSHARHSDPQGRISPRPFANGILSDGTNRLGPTVRMRATGVGINEGAPEKPSDVKGLETLLENLTIMQSPF